MTAATIFLQGAGGIASSTGLTLTMQGIGLLHLCDHEIVQPSNLSRQLFQPEDLFQNKAHRLARRLSGLGLLGTTLIGHPLSFNEFVAEHPDFMPDVIVSGVDNNAARLQACQWARKLRRPLVVAGVARDASAGYVLVQEPGKACLGCHLGKTLLDGGALCPGTPAVMDVLQVVGGFLSYGVTSLLMPRSRSWNLVRFFMGSGEWKVEIIEPRESCPVCHGKGA